MGGHARGYKQTRGQALTTQEITDICAIAGKPNEATEFIRLGKTAAEVLVCLVAGVGPYGKARKWADVNSEIANGSPVKRMRDVIPTDAFEMAATFRAANGR